MNKTVTLVSAVVIDGDCNFGRAATYVGDSETLEECVKSVKADALEDLDDNGGAAPFRIVVNVTTIPLPTDMPHIEIRGEVTDDTAAEARVTSEIS